MVSCLRPSNQAKGVPGESNISQHSHTELPQPSQWVADWEEQHRNAGEESNVKFGFRDDRNLMSVAGRLVCANRPYIQPEREKHSVLDLHSDLGELVRAELVVTRKD